ncbi:hypothetical protein ACFUAC_34820 [Streptomyces sp. NPDC057148]|uniref:hypothetical protein n=1 Tax=unclassified Streptomyces TaxID=2593676 RepID=UPI0036442E3D
MAEINYPGCAMISTDVSRAGVEVVLEGGRSTGYRYFLGRHQTAEAFDVHGDGREHVLQMSTLVHLGGCGEAVRA